MPLPTPPTPVMSLLWPVRRLTPRTLVNDEHVGGDGPRTRAQTLSFSLLSLYSSDNWRSRVERRRGADFAREDPRLVTRVDRTGCGGSSVLLGAGSQVLWSWVLSSWSAELRAGADEPRAFANWACTAGSLSLRYTSMALPFQPPDALRKTSGISISSAAVEAPCLKDRKEYYRGFFPSSLIRKRIYPSNHCCVGINCRWTKRGSSSLLNCNKYLTSLMGQQSSPVLFTISMVPRPSGSVLTIGI